MSDVKFSIVFPLLVLALLVFGVGLSALTQSTAWAAEATIVAIHVEMVSRIAF